MKQTESIKNLLNAKTHPDLAEMYSADMECQVNVAQDGGDRVEGEFKGKAWQAWTDGIQQWKSFRIPYNANSEPEYDDKDMRFDLAAHALGIGMTGWDWKNRRSMWVGYDFDAITGHSDRHQKKLTDKELVEVEKAVTSLEWVTVRRSTGGRGLHLYVFLDGVPTANHTEHAALARAILGKMAALTGFDFSSKVDVCGGNMWVWHRKMHGNDDGLKLIKKGATLTDVPTNWHDHITVVKGKRARTQPKFIVDFGDQSMEDAFDEITSRRAAITLDKGHEALIKWLDSNNALWAWDQDSKMLTCHTCDLLTAHEELGLKGIFTTISKGNEKNAEWNCYGFPIPNGGWVIRRFTPGVAESDTWEQDGDGWTRTFFNVDPDLKAASNHKGGVEDDKGGFNFRDAQSATSTAKLLGANLNIDNKYMSRNTRISMHKDGRIKVEVHKEDGDDGGDFKGWLPTKQKTWVKLFNVKAAAPVETEVANYDDMIRHLVTNSDGQDYTTGWTLFSDTIWRLKKKDDVKMFLRGTHRRTGKEVDQILGSCVGRPWTVVCKPFQPEFLGDRMWNRNAAQLRYQPSDTSNSLVYPSWMKILDHIGQGLDDAVESHAWCQANGILKGSDYLKCWIASLFQEPEQPLPYLFLYSEQQGTGKSIFHEALELLMVRGVVRADAALINPSGFNGELEGCVLGVIEETDLRTNRSAQERIKDWVTSSTIQIHQKGMTPYAVTNTCHFVHASNDYEYCPISLGDTRITMIEVAPLSADEMIPKKDLIPELEREAPDFLAEVLNLEIPPPADRLNVPVIETEIKQAAAATSASPLDDFIRENCFTIPGQRIKFGEFYDKFKEFLGDGVQGWSKIKTGRKLPQHVLKGRVASEGSQWYLGNISWEEAEATTPYILDGDKLVRADR